MQVEIQLVGKPNRWAYSQRRIRIGRDSSCDVSLPGNEYPMVSREHVVLEINHDVITLSDPRSGNGTFLNGQRVTAGTLRSDDILRLGADGPELQIRLAEPAAQTVIVSAGDSGRTLISDAATVTRFSTQPAVTSMSAAATVVADSAVSEAAATVGGAATVVATSCTVVSASPEANPVATRVAQTIDYQPTAPISQAQHSQVKINSTEAQGVAKNTSDIGDEQVIERKLNSIRTLLAANLAIMVVLLLGLFYENQQIERNRKDLSEMRLQAQTAVGQFTPALDARLNTFEKRMDGVDAKMKDAEDRLVLRMNKEIPAMLDKYVDQKVNQAKRQAELPRP
jgi:pSer/pThr/pTyr-binding forkhead associated (FHA) protein